MWLDYFTEHNGLEVHLWFSSLFIPNIAFCVYTAFCLPSHQLMDTCLTYCEHGCANVSLRPCFKFFWVYTQKWIDLVWIHHFPNLLIAKPFSLYSNKTDRCWDRTSMNSTRNSHSAASYLECRSDRSLFLRNKPKSIEKRLLPLYTALYIGMLHQISPLLKSLGPERELPSRHGIGPLRSLERSTLAQKGSRPSFHHRNRMVFTPRMALLFRFQMSLLDNL